MRAILLTVVTFVSHLYALLEHPLTGVHVDSREARTAMSLELIVDCVGALPPLTYGSVCAAVLGHVQLCYRWRL